VRGKAEGPTRAAPAPADLEELTRIDSEDALVRWAIAALPHRSSLDDEPRAALDAAFRARAAVIGASPDLILAFAEDVPPGEGLLPSSPNSGDDHAPHAPV
jgi:hypothetical protein